MVTKAIVRSINKAGNRCIVRMPLFETASSNSPVEAEALVSITPGLFNNIVVGDVVFVAFEENALEKPIIIGKLYKGTNYESSIDGGAGILDSLKVRNAASIPSSTLFVYKQSNKNEYKDFSTPKKMADYIKWLEKLAKNLISQLDTNFRCFKNWTQWQLQPENVEIDDGDIDTGYHVVEALEYQKENATCEICEKDCSKDKIRRYLKLDIDKKYPDN